jgi:predicted transcriptional regulator
VGIFITKEYIMKKIVRLTESDLTRIVKRVIKEDITSNNLESLKDYLTPYIYKVLKMKFVDNLSVKEIAEKLGLSDADVRSKIKKGVGQANKRLDLMDKESKITDEDRKKISDEMKKQKIDLFTTKLITMVDHFSETLSQEEINRVLRKLIK